MHLLYQSMITNRYMNPLLILIYVMSMPHTWSGCVMGRFLSRYGFTCSAWYLLLRLGLGYTVIIPIFPIIRLTAFLFIRMSLLSMSVILRYPYVGLSVWIWSIRCIILMFRSSSVLALRS